MPDTTNGHYTVSKKTFFVQRIITDMKSSGREAAVKECTVAWPPTTLLKHMCTGRTQERSFLWQTH